MLIESANSNKIVINLSAGMDLFGVQRLLDYARYLEATAQSRAKQPDVDKLADEVSSSWWAKNKKRFLHSKILFNADYSH